MSMRSVPLKLIAMLTLTACYTYQPLSSPEPLVGSKVAVQLTDEGSRHLLNQIGPNVLHVVGDVVSVDSSALRLSVHQVEDQRGIASSWNGERVTLPRTALAGVQQRRLAVGGTGLMGGAVLLAVMAVYQALGGGKTPEGHSGGGGAPQ